MAIKELWGYARKPGLLARLSGGRGGRAALILTGVYLVPPLAFVLIWLIGLAPIFYELHWIPALVATLVVVGSLSVVARGVHPRDRVTPRAVR